MLYNHHTTNIISLEPSLFLAYEYGVLRKFIYQVWICIALFGLAANIPNIVVFAKIALKDNVTITLLFLSISDLLFIAITSPIMVGRYMEVNQRQHIWPFHLYIILLGPYWYAYVFYDYSSFISVFLATVAHASRDFSALSLYLRNPGLSQYCLFSSFWLSYCEFQS